MEGNATQDGNLCSSPQASSMEITIDVPAMDCIQLLPSPSVSTETPDDVPAMDSIRLASSSSKREDKPMTLVDSEIETSKIHWSEPFSDGTNESIKSNKEFYQSLQKKWGTNFFWGSDGKMSMLKKIGEGGQAEIFNVVHTMEVLRVLSYAIYDQIFVEPIRHHYVLKVFKEGFLLEDLEKQWPLGMLENQKRNSFQTGYSTQNCCRILGATLLENGRFAFLMKEYWGDLRKAIDGRMRNKSYPYLSPPFTNTEVGHIVVKIAWGMRELHKNNIVHGDLKASNVLVDVPKTYRYRLGPIHTNGEHWKVKVADFECSVGVVGTTYWRAPEILQAVQDRNIQPQLFTEKVDVYGFAMTCYEVLTGKMPFQDLERDGTQYMNVIQGGRPKLPEDINPLLRTLLNKCWHGDPLERPSFKEITKSLREIYPSVHVPRRWVWMLKQKMTSCMAAYRRWWFVVLFIFLCCMIFFLVIKYLTQWY